MSSTEGANAPTAQEGVEWNRANWDERAPKHASSPDYCVQKLIDDPTFVSNVVKFDEPLLGSLNGLSVVHLQCHIGTDTLSLARRGAASVVGVDFSSASLAEAKSLAAKAAGGEKLSFVHSTVDDATSKLPNGEFDLVFTGIGALCWLPDIRAWARTVAALLKPKTGRLFIREGHPILWALDLDVADRLDVRFPYFETAAPTVWETGDTYVSVASDTVFEHNKTAEWNHGIGEIVQALLDAGMTVTGLVEHQSVPWKALPHQMVHTHLDEYALADGRNRMPLTYTLQAVKR